MINISAMRASMGTAVRWRGPSPTLISVGILQGSPACLLWVSLSLCSSPDLVALCCTEMQTHTWAELQLNSASMGKTVLWGRPRFCWCDWKWYRRTAKTRASIQSWGLSKHSVGTCGEVPETTTSHKSRWQESHIEEPPLDTLSQPGENAASQALWCTACERHLGHSTFSFSLSAQKALRFSILPCKPSLNITCTEDLSLLGLMVSINQSRFPVHDPQTLHEDLLHWDLSSMDRRSRTLSPLLLPHEMPEGHLSFYMALLMVCLPALFHQLQLCNGVGCHWGVPGWHTTEEKCVESL